MSENVKLIEAWAKLAAPLAWPTTILISLWLFRATIQNLFANLSEASFKGFGVEVAAKRIFVEAMTKAASREGEPSETGRITAETLADSISFTNLRGKRVLWVANIPEKYESERLALLSLGLEVTRIAPRREDMFVAIHATRIDAVVTEGILAGVTLHVEELTRMLEKYHLSVPVIVYSNLRDPAEFEKVRKLVSGWATTPTELMRTVEECLQPSMISRLRRYLNLAPTYRYWH